MATRHRASKGMAIYIGVWQLNTVLTTKVAICYHLNFVVTPWLYILLSYWWVWFRQIKVGDYSFGKKSTQSLWLLWSNVHPWFVIGIHTNITCSTVTLLWPLTSLFSSLMLCFWCTSTGPKTAKMSGRGKSSLTMSVSFLVPLSPHMLWVSDCHSSHGTLYLSHTTLCTCLT